MDDTAQNPISVGFGRESRLLDLSQALVEARRCLRCHDAPCARACPTHIDVPGFISRLAEEDYDGSYAVMVKPNPLPAVCGLVCPTLDLCEGACVLSQLRQRPIQIGALQYFVAGNYAAPESVPSAVSSRRVAVIGAGPSGLSCALELRRLGDSVTLFDRFPAAGGFLDQVIPHWRLPQQDVERELDRVRNAGLEFRLGANIDGEGAAALAQEYDAVYIAVGLNQSALLNLPGADLPGVMPALEFLRMTRRAMRGESAMPPLGECVAIVGGGNVALDAAAASLALGASRAIVLYRRTLAEMPAWQSEYVEAASMGVEFRWLSTILAILPADGKVGAVEVQPMSLTTRGADGRRLVEADGRSQPYVLRCDTVLLAVGQGLERDVAEAVGLEVTREGTIAVAPGTGQTARSNIFAGGDAVSGGTTVVQAVANGVAAAHAIHSWLQGREDR